MSKRTEILKRLNKSLSPDKVDFSSIDAELDALKKKLTESVNIQTVDDVSRKLKQFQKSIDFEPLLRAFENLKTNLAESDRNSIKELQQRLTFLTESVKGASLEGVAHHAEALKEISELRVALKELSDRKPLDFTPQIQESERKLKELISSLDKKKDIEKVQDDLNDLTESLRKLRLETANRGGAMNRQINVNSSVMSSKYTDINFVSDTAIRWSASDDATNKRVNIFASLISGGASGSSLDLEVNGVPNVDQTLLNLVEGTNMTITDNGDGSVTFDATGGAGSGITRTASIITADTTGSGTASVDRVYFAQVGLTFTLPSAVNNLNLYTIKNQSGSSVLVLSGEGIDDSPSALMPSNYESLSFLSNQSVWGVV